MNGTLGRDKLWNQQIWSDIDKAVQDEVGRIRVVQKVLPGIVRPNGQLVPADKLDEDDEQYLRYLSIPEGDAKAFIEISREFRLTQSQVDGEESLHVGRTLARMAAKAVALAEDKLLLQGSTLEHDPGKAQQHQQGEKMEKHLYGISLRNPDSVAKGLLGVAKQPIRGVARQEILVANWKINPAEIFQSVVKGISTLTDRGQSVPYALFLSSEIYADTFASLPDFPATVADRIVPLVTGGFYGTPALPPTEGLLVSLAGEPTTIYIGVDAITEFARTDSRGNYSFRVFERIQYVARDAGAFERLTFGQGGVAGVAPAVAAKEAALAAKEAAEAAKEAALAAKKAAEAAKEAALAMKAKEQGKPEKG
jgi:uncharacterized linocin/CFP29 family protein